MPVLTTDSQARKAIPLATGLLDYFPGALAAVAALSVAGNEKHNPGQPLHWSRGKSNDHADTILRHLADRGEVDPEDGIRHSVKVAWRALALLQEELEREEGVTPGRGSVFEKEEDRQPRSTLDKTTAAEGVHTLALPPADLEHLDLSGLGAIPIHAWWTKEPVHWKGGERLGNEVGQLRFFKDGYHRRVA